MYNISVHLSVDAYKSVVDAWCLIPISTAKRTADVASYLVFFHLNMKPQEKKEKNNFHKMFGARPKMVACLDDNVL